MEMLQEIQELKEKFRALWIASYRISGLSEEDSLRSYIREKNSFKYAFVRCPYGRSKNLIFRLMKVDIWRPSLPMGYYGCPGFFFDYLGESPLAEAIKIAEIMLKKRYKPRKMDEDRVSFRKVKEDSEGVELTEADREYLRSRASRQITGQNKIKKSWTRACECASINQPGGIYGKWKIQKIRQWRIRRARRFDHCRRRDCQK